MGYVGGKYYKSYVTKYYQGTYHVFQHTACNRKMFFVLHYDKSGQGSQGNTRAASDKVMKWAKYVKVSEKCPSFNQLTPLNHSACGKDMGHFIFSAEV